MKKKLAISIVAVLVLIVVAGAIYANQFITSQAQVVEENPQIASTAVEYQSEFVATDNQGRIDGEINLRLVEAELTKQVLVQGNPANAKGEKAFLVLHIEVDNSEADPKYLAPHDLFRLAGDGDRRFAPDIHSSIVEVQPISTKISRIGFVVPQNQREFHLYVGELEGEKQQVTVTFGEQ